MSEHRIGTVTHYYDEPEVGVIALDAPLEIGDTVRFTGHTTEFRQTVRSMEIEHESVERADAGTEVAMKVENRVREGDEVYRVDEG